MQNKNTTANISEVEKFSKIADEWWDEKGKFKPLHKMNPVRLKYIKDFAGDLKGKKILDIGCGGGLLAAPMCRMGGNVTGVDASQKNILIAQNYAIRQSLKIDYRNTLVEDLPHEFRNNFDIVTALEVIEHVDNVDIFLSEAAKMLKSGGLLFVSTINRTLKSFALAKVGAEYILRWVPVGTHDWQKFIKPEEVSKHLSGDFDKLDLSGFVFNPLTDTWNLSNKTDVNYIMVFQKK